MGVSGGGFCLARQQGQQGPVLLPLSLARPTANHQPLAAGAQARPRAAPAGARGRAPHQERRGAARGQQAPNVDATGCGRAVWAGRVWLRVVLCGLWCVELLAEGLRAHGHVDIRNRCHADVMPVLRWDRAKCSQSCSGRPARCWPAVPRGDGIPVAGVEGTCLIGPCNGPCARVRAALKRRFCLSWWPAMWRPQIWWCFGGGNGGCGSRVARSCVTWRGRGGGRGLHWHVLPSAGFWTRSTMLQGTFLSPLPAALQARGGRGDRRPPPSADS